MIRLVTAASALLLIVSPVAATAQDWPAKQPIKIIVPFTAGSATDIAGRIVFDQVGKQIGQNFVFENRGGAGTTLGAAMAAKADPDGYTLVIVVSNHTTNPALNANMPYDALKDFEPISLLGRAAIVPYVHPSFPPKNVKELVALAKAKPGTINFGSAGLASMTHLTAEQFKIQAGIDMTHVVYRGGSPALNVRVFDDKLGEVAGSPIASLGAGQTVRLTMSDVVCCSVTNVVVVTSDCAVSSGSKVS